VGKAYFLKHSVLDRLGVVTKRKIIEEGELKRKNFFDRLELLKQKKIEVVKFR
jgi:hypothetical protein